MARSRVNPVVSPHNSVTALPVHPTEPYPNLIGWKKRQCTDVMGLAVLVLMWVGLAILSTYAFDEGDPDRYVYGHDSYGNTCGRKNNARSNAINSGLDLRGYDHLLYFDARYSPNSIQICVKECPGSDADATETLQSAGYCLSSAGPGPYTADPVSVNYNLSGAAVASGCPKIVYASAVTINRCVPTNVAPRDIRNATVSLMDKNGIVPYVLHDLHVAEMSLLYFVLVIMAVCFLVHVFTRIWPVPMIDATFVLAVVMLWGGTGWLWDEFREKNDAYFDQKDGNSVVVANSVRADRILFLSLAIISTVLACFMTVGIGAFFRRIRHVPMMYMQTNAFLRKSTAVYSTTVFLVVTYAVLLGVAVYFVKVVKYATTKDEQISVLPNHVVFVRDRSNWIWAYALSFVLIVVWIVGITVTAVGTAVVRWYFFKSRSDSNIKYRFLGGILSHAVAQTLRFHVGTVLCGSVASAIISPFRPWISCLQQRYTLRHVGARVSTVPRVQRMLFSMASVGLSALGDVGLRGVGLLSASQRSLHVQFRNAPLVASLASTMWYSLLCGKMCVTGLALVTSMWWFSKEETVEYPSLFVALASISGFVLAEVTYGIYTAFSSAVLYCFCEDITVHDGSDAQPRYASHDLTLFLAREERRFQRIVEDTFALRVAAAKKAQANYELALTFHVDSHIATDEGNTSRATQEHWHKSRSSLRVPSLLGGRDGGVAATPNASPTRMVQHEPRGAVMATTHGTADDSALDHEADHIQTHPAQHIADHRENHVVKHGGNHTNTHGAGEGSVPDVSYFAARTPTATTQSPAGAAPTRQDTQLSELSRNMPPRGSSEGFSQQILAMFARPDASSTPGASVKDTPFRGTATLRGHTGSFELEPVRGAMPRSSVSSVASDTASQAAPRLPAGLPSHDDVVAGGTAWNGDYGRVLGEDASSAMHDEAVDGDNNGGGTDTNEEHDTASSGAASESDHEDAKKAEESSTSATGDDVF